MSQIAFPLTHAANVEVPFSYIEEATFGTLPASPTFVATKITTGLTPRMDDMEMDVGVDHHQHQIIDPLVAAERRKAVLDRGDDNGLLGESLEERLLAGREVASLARIGRDHADDRLAHPQRHREHGADSLALVQSGIHRARIPVDVVYSERRARLCDPSDDALAHRRGEGAPLRGAEALRGHVLHPRPVGAQEPDAAARAPDELIHGAADGGEHRGQMEPRADEPARLVEGERQRPAGRSRVIDAEVGRAAVDVDDPVDGDRARAPPGPGHQDRDLALGLARAGRGRGELERPGDVVLGDRDRGGVRAAERGTGGVLQNERDGLGPVGLTVGTERDRDRLAGLPR